LISDRKLESYEISSILMKEKNYSETKRKTALELKNEI
jgi:hypothetical protein